MTPPEGGLEGQMAGFSVMGGSSLGDSTSDDSGVVVEGTDSVVPTAPSEDNPDDY